MRYTIVDFDGAPTITIFHGGKVLVAQNTHPYWEQITAGALAGDESVLSLIDLKEKVKEEFSRLSERMTVVGSRVFWDGDEVDNSLTQQIIRFIEAGVDDWKPLVAFAEKVYTNPNEHSREQLFGWLNNNKFTITDDGDVVAYKGVHKSDNDEWTYKSTTQGKEDVMVDGVVQKGYIYQNVGSVVEMPRSVVNHDPTVGCSVGLHVSTHRYAGSYVGSNGGMLRVLVNPRDFVSVPDDGGFEKARVSRYVVESVVTEPTKAPVLYVTPTTYTGPSVTVNGPVDISAAIGAGLYSTLDEEDEEENEDDTCSDCYNYHEDCTCYDDEDDEDDDLSWGYDSRETDSDYSW